MEKPKDVDQFIAHQRAAIAANPECGTSHYNLGIALMGKKQYAEAERAFGEAVECSPTLAEGYVQLGALRLREGDLEGCLAYNQKAVKVRPGFSEGWGNVGFVYMQQGDLGKAIWALERATHFNFRFVQAFTTLGNAYLMKGRVDDSIAANLKALELEPDFAVAHNNLTIAYLEKNDPEKAAHHLERALALGYDVAPDIRAEVAARGQDSPPVR